MELLFKRLPGATARIAQCHIQLRHSSKFSQYGNSPIPENKKKFVPDCGKYPKGFNVGSINVGIKPDSKSQPDLILVASDTPSNGAAVFTKNEFPAASITVSKDVMQKTGGSGIGTVIANSWCANTLTGKAGLEDAQAMSREAAQNMGGNISPAIVMHTGMGGQRLPIDSILQGIPKIYQTMGNSHDQWLEAARGLCTTDTFPKLGSRTFTLPSSPGVTFSIAGITKGAGMIHPNMATTLGIFCTDASVSPAALKQSLNTAADKSYNCISIDGDTSTNDMVALLANGAAGGTEVGFDPNGTTQTKDFGSFQRTLIEFMADMAKLVVRDGEGATKFITIRVRGAPSDPAGKHIASVIARSVLFKAGIYGKDANWGNALAALGYSLADTKFANQGIIVPELTSVSFMYEGRQINFLDKGVPVEVNQETATRVMDEEDIEVLVDLRDDGQQYEEAVYWTCDLTHEFVTINGDFRT